MTHIQIKLTITGPDNGLWPGRRKVIIWTNAGILLIGPLVTKLSEILIEIYLGAAAAWENYPGFTSLMVSYHYLANWSHNELHERYFGCMSFHQNLYDFWPCWPNFGPLVTEKWPQSGISNYYLDYWLPNQLHTWCIHICGKSCHSLINFETMEIPKWLTYTWNNGIYSIGLVTTDTYAVYAVMVRWDDVVMNELYVCW